MTDILLDYPDIQRVLLAITAAFDPADMPDENFHRLAKAAVIGALLDDDQTHPNDIHDLLTPIQGDYGCWMGCVKAAIEKADLGFCDDPCLIRDLLLVSHRMATICIWGDYKLQAV
jgi:hypothetical protein